MRFISLIVLLFLCGNISAQKIEWYSTTQAAPWVKQKVKVERNDAENKIVLDTSKRLQLITGIGGCFNEMGWDALNVLSAEAREDVLKAIFGKDGACFEYCRLPMGANDFAMSFYSSADVAGDFNLVNFNIDRDRYILIPYIKAARQINPNLRIWASPWCPPAWMKTNNHYASAIRPSGEKDVNGLAPSEAIAEFSTGFRMEEGYLKTYANYFARFIKAYEAEGLPLECIHVQNEPCSNQIFPSCKWRTEDLTFFLGHYLGPTFEKENIKTDIYFGTINTANPDYVRVALRDEQAAKYIKGVGFQWDGKKAIPTIHREYPELKLMQTETECGNGANSWDYAEYTWNLMKHYFSNGINSYHYWNMILPSPGISPWGWNQNSMVSIDKNTHTVTYNPEFYLMKHLGHFVQTGAYMLETPSDKNMLAFVNPDGTVSVIVANVTNTDETITLEVGKQKVTLALPPHSFHSVSWKQLPRESEGNSAIQVQMTGSSNNVKQQAFQTFPGTKSKWHEGDRYDFKFDGRDAVVVAPKKAAPGNPWIWRPAFFDAFPSVDIALLEKGFHVAYLDVTNDYASPWAIGLGNRFYKEMVESHGLSSKVVMEGFSRGGLYSVIWGSRNPDNVACLYLDAPLSDVFTCLKKLHKEAWNTLLKEWKLTEETIDRFDGNPIDNLEPLVKAGVPIISVCGDSDRSVPIEENMMVIRDRYLAMGGTVELIIKPGCDHHPHSLDNPQPVVDFILNK